MHNSTRLYVTLVSCSQSNAVTASVCQGVPQTRARGLNYLSLRRTRSPKLLNFYTSIHGLLGLHSMGPNAQSFVHCHTAEHDQQARFRGAPPRLASKLRLITTASF